MSLCNSFFLNRQLACYQFFLPKLKMKAHITEETNIRIMFFFNLNYFLMINFFIIKYIEERITKCFEVGFANINILEVIIKIPNCGQ